MFQSLPITILLITGVLFLSPTPWCVAQEYYVTPTQPPNHACPSGKPCHTLNDYVKNASSLFCGKVNVSLLFLEGTHNLSEQSLEISNTVSLTMVTANLADKFAIGRIHMIDQIYIMLRNVSFVSIVRLNFGSNGSFPNYNTGILGAAIQTFEQRDLFLTNTSVSLSSTGELYVQNTKFVYTFLQFSYSESDAYPYVNNSITLTTKQCNMFHSGLLFDFVGSENTTKPPKFNAMIKELYMIDCQGTRTNTFSPSPDNDYLGLVVNLVEAETHLSVEDSRFTNKSRLVISSENATAESATLLKNVTFSDNLNSVAVFLLGPANVIIDTCNFVGNRGYPSAFVAYSVDIVFSGKTTFSNNVGTRGGAMNLFYSRIYLKHDTSIKFTNNRALDLGGAVFLEDFPKLEGYQISAVPIFIKQKHTQCFYQLMFDPLTNPSVIALLEFDNNMAQNGGDHIYGVSLQSLCIVRPGENSPNSYMIQDKLFSLSNPSRSSLSPVTSSTKRVCLCENGQPICGNTSYIVQEREYTSGEVFSVSVAVVGGDFGTVTGGVYATLANTSSYSVLNQGENLHRFMHTKCNDLEYSVHSKKHKELLLLAADQQKVFQNYNTSEQFGNDFHTSLDNAILGYNIGGFIDNFLQNVPILLYINILPCPLGFVLSGDPPTCQCSGILLNNDVYNCVVINGTGLVYRNGTTWVSHSGSDHNETDSVLVHKYCPYEYCKTDNIAVDLFNPDTQCAFNHSGILCGGCPPNLSLALGSSQCLSCNDDRHIALLVLFVLAGIALVILIKVLDLTIVRGTTNGLVVYSNILWINQSIFFPDGGTETSQALLQVMHVLKVFVAWLNLDLGIETCFYQGLNAYWKTWLQFIFPSYVWGIAIAIIVACRYSPTAVKLFGKNAVHVLATLFLLSYAKLLRTIITALGFAIFYYPDSIRMVWLFDGNIPYFRLQHSFLFVAALLALLLLWLPYTVTLLLVPCQSLRKRDNHCSLRWMQKWKPLYDSYYGPLKDNRQYWIGGTLLVRVFFAITAVAIQAIAPTVNVLLMLLTSALLCVLVTCVYKKNYVSVLNASFFFNLVALCSVFLYTDSQETKLVFVCISVGIAFVSFLGIVLFHAHSMIKKCFPRRNLRRVNGAVDNPLLRVPQQERRPVLNVAEYREPLLEDESED